MTASGALATIGQGWRDELRKTTLTPNQLPAPDEDAGYAYFEQLKSKVIPGCIPGAVNAGSNEIILDAPLGAIQTHAFEGFLEWARSQDMEARFGGIVRAESDTTDCRAVIRLTVDI